MEKQVVYLLDSERYLEFRGMTFYVCSNNRRELVARLPSSLIKRLFSLFNLTSRIFRIQVRAVVRLDESIFVLSMFGGVWRLDLEDKSIKKVFTSRECFSSPLNLCVFNDFVYWGDYGRNASYEPVQIYCLNKKGDVKLMYTFKSGRIRHVHNIIHDSNENMFWVLCGDNESDAGIYRALIDFSEVYPFKIGEPRYRAVMAFSTNNGLLYATDSVESINHVYLLKYDGEIIDLGEINGSSIYGCENLENYFFSTTVEPTERINGIMTWFTAKLGEGIKNTDVHLICLSKLTGVFTYKI